MVDRMHHYVETLFADAPQSAKARELREELLANCLDKYNDLTAKGMPPQEAYEAVAAGIGDMSDIIGSLEDEEESSMKTDLAKKRNALHTTIAMALYFLAFLSLVTGGMIDRNSSAKIGFIVCIVFAGAATCLLVYSNSLYAPYKKKDDTFAEEYKERSDKRKTPLGDAAQGLLWMAAVGLFLYTGLEYGKWEVNWIIFPVTAGISGLIGALIRR